MRALGKVLIAIVLLPVVVIGGVVVFGSTPAEPVAWKPGHMPSLNSGPYANNALLNDAHVFGTDNLLQPESIAPGPNGLLYTGMNTGEIVRFNPAKTKLPQNPQTTPFELIANTQGRPLGLVFHPAGYLVVADGTKGLLKVTLQGDVTVLSNESEGLPFKFVDDVAVTADGRYAYFSDASSKFDLNNYVLDLIEHGGNGRLLRYDFQTGETQTLLRNLQFANGVTLSKAGDYVLVNETAAYRITRYWLAGDKAGTSDTFIDGLPGFPDNIRTDADGNYWVAIPSLRDPMLDSLADKPSIRKALAKLLNHVEFPVKPKAMALAINPDGVVIANLQAEKAGDYYYYVTQVTPFDGKLYLSSVHINGAATASNPLSR
ncbi:MAG: SMP-30/gluconolactonase/LRE family protein [Gammaproteobacteria bacterium]|uniref:SMP-30/gluconolactonase/LRE family protein n=1 Tax=Limnobacter sp. TaxID=2003368 RepID=UPI001D43F503|nr:SMP-30/gluconolactonase/LRE family protein [Limnobacter sp.]MBU0784106.1 SMP-30/gluconolactonase/LRE family protein [Gammaproteobacteria bacterium]MBU0849844.1 SMP-30/gluconolactonase/LRE family protein [Gammaproteobacteria bacterium]MBU1528714.1 SMP-30/gluconolactonase/LRE family protein [Gammaproteobacteria bacterium]MBU1779710.1 SMP-30/gluconolactonase/LRE family protein [Gammaproteobacteria bacterium]MBU2088838.1 SMP-30/gluconolactonase/LRE family protein [Gammaproteobacteria bacterium]